MNTHGWHALEGIERDFALFERMLLIREFEEAAHLALEEGLIRGPLHQSIGQEAVAVGVCANLGTTDLLQSNHRGHGHALAKGATPEAMMLELFGRRGGTNGGKGGSMHIADFSVGMMGANGILGDGVTLAVGAAHAVKIKGDTRVVCAFLGDGATNRGPFYEALNWCKVFELPLLLVCEDNGYASSTRTTAVSAGQGSAARVRAFDIPVLDVDGNDLNAVDEASRQLVNHIRAGHGPQFMHAKTYRIKGHISRDPLTYRPAGETERNLLNDPTTRTAAALRAHGIPEAVLNRARESARARVLAAVAAAKEAPYPEIEQAFTDVQDAGAPCRS